MTIIDDRKFQTMPDLSEERFAALKSDIAAHRVLIPIELDEDGRILDGHHRYRACMELGFTDFPIVIRTGLEEVDKRPFARKANALRRQLDHAQMRKIIADQLKETPTRANRWIANDLGVDHKTVQAVRSELESTGEIPQLDCFLGQDGKSRRRVIRSIHVPSDQDRHEQEKIQEAVNDKVEEEKIVRQVKEDSEQETDLPRDHDEKAQEDHLETNENDVDEPNLGQATPDQHIDTLAELLSAFLKQSLPSRLALSEIEGGVDKHFLLRLHELVDDLKDAHEDLAATIRRVSGTANCKDADEGRFEEEFVMTAEQLDEGVTERNRRWAEAKRAVLDSMEDSEAEVASGVVDGTSVARERWSTWRREFEQQQRERQEEGAVYEGMIGEEAEAVNW